MSNPADITLKLCVLGASFDLSKLLVMRYLSGTPDPQFSAVEHWAPVVDKNLILEHPPSLRGKNLRVLIFYMPPRFRQRFRSLWPTFFQGAHGIIGAFDLASQDSFQNLQELMLQVSEVAPALPLVYVGLDLGSEVVIDDSQIENALESHAVHTKYFTVTPNDNAGVDSAFEGLTHYILGRDYR